MQRTFHSMLMIWLNSARPSNSADLCSAPRFPAGVPSCLWMQPKHSVTDSMSVWFGWIWQKKVRLRSSIIGFDFQIRTFYKWIWIDIRPKRNGTSNSMLNNTGFKTHSAHFRGSMNSIKSNRMDLILNPSMPRSPRPGEDQCLTWKPHVWYGSCWSERIRLWKQPCFSSQPCFWSYLFINESLTWKQMRIETC